ncbi:MAG: LPS export ABC transporter permease LptG [Steroidobacteraceae bacterium]
MRVLDRYIVKAVGGSVSLVLTVLLTLLALFLFIDEQGWVGVGSYGNLQAVHYVVLNLSATLVQFLPVAALIGSLRATGALAGGSELTVMRASGIPVWRIAVSVLFAGLLMVPFAVVVGEYLAPPLTQMARINKAVQRNANISLTGRSSAWIPDGRQILRAERLSGEAGFGGITLFEIAPGNQLLAVGQAHGAHVTADGSWELEGYVQSRFEPQRVSSGSFAAQRLNVSASPAFLGAIASDPKELSQRELRSAIAHLRANGQDSRRYRFAYWSKVAGLAAIPLAVLLAVPFMFGPLRSAEGGARAMLGLAFGLAYFIFQRMVESGTVVFDLDPLLLAWLPATLLAAAVALLLIRLQRRV